MDSKKKERLGEVKRNKEHLGGYEMRIVEYKNKEDIIIEFQDEYKTKINTRYENFKKGSVKNPYHKEIFEVGYVGKGKYKPSENGKHIIAYEYWYNMMNRCYNAYYLNDKPTYRDCYVCNEWHNFQNFAKWFEENYYNVNNQRMHLDKDILCKNNKVYSPRTCIFVPMRINQLFVRNNIDRGGYPIGTHYNKKNNCLCVKCSVFDSTTLKKKTKYLASFPLNRPFQAFYTYKQFKENYIKQVADEYKDLIPKELYDAMYKWEVEIND